MAYAVLQCGPSRSTDREKLLSFNGGRFEFFLWSRHWLKQHEDGLRIPNSSVQFTTNAGGEALLRFHRKISFIKESYNASEDENQRRFAPDAAAGTAAFLQSKSLNLNCFYGVNVLDTLLAMS